MKSILLIFVWIAFAYVVFVLLLVVGQRSLLYFPDTHRPDMAQHLPGQWMRTVTSDGLTLHGWWIAPKDDTRPVLVLFHGNAIHIGPRITKIPAYLKAGWGVLLAEYRGYGGNPGLPFEEGLYRDARAYMEWLTGTMGVEKSRIVIYGESLGSGVATQIASETPGIKALILDASFVSALALARLRVPLVPFIEHLYQDHYRNDLKIGEVKAPVLIGVAGQDFVIPEAVGGRALYAFAKDPKALALYPTANHLNLQDHGFPADVVAFVEEGKTP